MRTSFRVHIIHVLIFYYIVKYETSTRSFFFVILDTFNGRNFFWTNVRNFFKVHNYRFYTIASKKEKKHFLILVDIFLFFLFMFLRVTMVKPL